jgi:hypothetical protein
MTNREQNAFRALTNQEHGSIRAGPIRMASTVKLANQNQEQYSSGG